MTSAPTINFGDVIGRQPETLYVIPSKPNPWYGTWFEGDDLSVQQRTTLSRREIDQSKVEIVKVYRQATSREMYWSTGYGSLPPLFEFACPVIRREKDGFVRVVTPFGDVKRVIPLFGRLWANAPRGLRQANRHIHTRDWEKLNG